ncbi:hypothetical protein KUCAC02_016904 [Chaenocephalus aceratus]|nr:hypothetical protein KUCAC02_016904 [Chaenocephalus aceratus]
MNARLTNESLEAKYLEGEASLDSSSPDFVPSVFMYTKQSQNPNPKMDSFGGGELTLQQINVLLLKLQNKNAAWIIVLV